MFCEGSSASSSHGLARNIAVKESVETRDEEVPGGDRAVRCDPKRRRKRESLIARGKIFDETNERVDVGVLFLLDNDTVALEKLVCFVAGQVKFILVR